MHKKLFNKDYLLLLQGHLFTVLGAVLYSAAISYWVYQQTGSTSLMGILGSITTFIIMFMSPVAGAITDHLKRRSVLVLTDLIRGVMFLVLGILAVNGKLSVVMLVLSAAFSGICSSLFNPAASSLTPDILHESVLIKGQSVMSGGISVINLVGSALSGILIVALGVPVLILVNGITYLISAFSECFITDYPSHNKKSAIDLKLIVSDLKKGWKLAMSSPCLSAMFKVMILGNLLSSGFFNLLAAYASDYGMSTQQYGYLSAAFSLGSVLGMVILSVVNMSKEKRMKLAIASYLASETIIAVGFFIARFYVTAPMLVAGALLNAIGNGIVNAALILMMPKKSRGMLTGLVTTMVAMGSGLSSLIYGFLGEFIPLNILGSCFPITSVIPFLFISKNKAVMSGNWQPLEDEEQAAE